jgi:hypothetical protein
MGWKTADTSIDNKLILRGIPPDDSASYPYNASDTVLTWTVDPEFIIHPNWFIYTDDLPWANKGVNFKFDVTFSVTSPEYFIIVETTATLVNSAPRDEVVITGTSVTTSSSTGSVFTALGKYWSGWNDNFLYVEAGASDRTQNPSIANDIETMPEEKNFYKLEQDLTDFLIKKYTHYVYIAQTIYDGGTKFDGSYRVIGDVFVKTESDKLLEQRIYNNYQETTNFVANYKYNGEERI